MLILGIETSCDETGVALFDSERGLLSHALFSQIDMHADYGGVVPELASRDHVRKLLPLCDQVLADAGKTRVDLEGIAYTAGPGLVGALMVGGASNLFSRLRQRPATVTLVPGLILLVPGSIGFRSVSAMLAQDALSGIQAAFAMTLVAIALVTGLLISHIVVPPRGVL